MVEQIMELEQRVQALEQEVQLLKNQIQVTLLEIQEQLLSNRYPALRADIGTTASTAATNPTPTNDASAAIPLTPYEQELMQASPTRPVRIPTPTPEFDPETTVVAPPRRRREMLADNEVDPRDQRDNRTRHAGAVEDTDWTSRADLEYWVRGRVQQAGIERARHMIYDYAAKGRYSIKVRDHLLRYAGQYDPDNRITTLPISEKGGQFEQTNYNEHGDGNHTEHHSRTAHGSAHNSANHRNLKKGVNSRATNGKVPHRGTAQPHPDE